MLTCRRLPIEIINQVVTYVSDTKDLLQCQLVSKNWHRLAQKLLYTTVTLNSKQATIAYLNTVDGSAFQLGDFTTTIYFNYPIDDVPFIEVPQLLEKLFISCPNLKRLEEVNPQGSDSWFIHLNSVLNLHPLPLERISESAVWGTNTLYYFTVLALHQTLTQLTLLQLLRNDSHNPFYEQLVHHTLPRLKTLKVIMNEGSTLSRFDDFIQACPSLHTLRCLDRTHFKNKKSQRERDLMEHAMYSSSSSTLHSEAIFNAMPYHEEKVIDLSVIKMRRDIKVCEGYFVINCGESILYFMHKFPQLQRLDIRIDSDFDFESASEFNFKPEIMKSFLIYVSKIPSFCVDDIRMPDTIGVLISFMEETSFAGIIEIEYQESIDDNFKLWTGTNPKLKYENYYTKHTLEQKITVIFPINRDDQELITSIEKDIYLPHIDMIQRMHHLVKRLSLSESYGERSTRGYEMLTDMAEWMGVEPDYDVYALNEIFSNCMSLNILYLNLLQLMECEPSDIVGVSESLETLDVFRSNLSVTILPQLSARLPALKNLCMTKCTMITEINNTIKIHMPETSFNTISCIDPILYDLTSTEFYLKLETDDTQEVQYYKSVNNLLNTCPLQDYNNSLGDSGIISFDIYCKNLDVFWFRIGKTEKRKFIFT